MKHSRDELHLPTTAALVPTLAAVADQDTLYTRLGGMPALQAVAGDLVDRILADPRVNPWFYHAAASPENTAAYKRKLTEFLSQNIGGPCQYDGLDMVAAHKGRAVSSDAFDAVAEDLMTTLSKFKVPEKETAELLNIVASLKSCIVQR